MLDNRTRLSGRSVAEPGRATLPHCCSTSLVSRSPPTSPSFCLTGSLRPLDASQTRLACPRWVVERLRSFGLSQAKAEYMTGLATMQSEAAIDVEHMDQLDDAQAVAALTSVRGVGTWSAEMFLIHQLHRPDVLPAGDLGIRRAIEAAGGCRSCRRSDCARAGSLVALSVVCGSFALVVPCDPPARTSPREMWRERLPGDDRPR